MLLLVAGVLAATAPEPQFICGPRSGRRHAPWCVPAPFPAKPCPPTAGPRWFTNPIVPSGPTPG